MSRLNLSWMESRLRKPWTIFWIAFLVRVVYLTLAQRYRIPAYEDHFGFGYEMGRIARALATGHGYADPFHGHTGPTAWVTPLFPLILGAVFKIFGVYTALSAWVILAFNCLLNALMIPLIREIGLRCFNGKVALWSAWIWALYPAAMQYAVRWVWEMTLTAFLFQLALVVALRIGCVGNQPCDGPAWSRWLGFGLLWGLIALSNPGVLLFLPACGVWMLARSGRDWLKHFPKAICAALVFLAVLAPWSLRNSRALHGFVLLRSNFGAELYLGNGPGAEGFLMEYDHPNPDPEQYRLYAQMGELRYSAWRGELAKKAIRDDLPRFLRNCLLRVYFYWFGSPNPPGRASADFLRSLNYGFTSCAGLIGLALALRRRKAAAALFAAAFLLIPPAYYLIAATARFRHPLEPLIAILGVFLFQQAELRWGWTLPGLRRLMPVKADSSVLCVE